MVSNLWINPSAEEPAGDRDEVKKQVIWESRPAQSMQACDVGEIRNGVKQ